MKRMIAFVIIWVLIISTYTKAEEKYLNSKELVELANKEIIEMGLLGEDYFSKECNIAGKPLSENEHLKGYRNYIVYGNFHGDFKEDRYRYLKYTMMNAEFTNFLFPNDVTSKTGL